MPDDYVYLRPDDTRPVEVKWQGGWYPGELESYRRVDGVWSGWVRFTTGVAETQIDWSWSGGSAGRYDCQPSR